MVDKLFRVSKKERAAWNFYKKRTGRTSDFGINSFIRGLRIEISKLNK